MNKSKKYIIESDATKTKLNYKQEKRPQIKKMSDILAHHKSRIHDINWRNGLSAIILRNF